MLELPPFKFQKHIAPSDVRHAAVFFHVAELKWISVAPWGNYYGPYSPNSIIMDITLQVLCVHKSSDQGCRAIACT